MIMGTSGSGKSYLEKRLCQDQNYNKIVSFTTRSIRDGEVDGKDYIFISKEEYEKLENEGKVAQRTHFTGNIYGSLYSSYLEDKINTLCVTPTEGKRLSEDLIKMGWKVKFVYFNISRDKIISNMKQRGDSDEFISKRLGNDDLSEQYAKSGIVADLVVVDADLDDKLHERVKLMSFV
jgi:guanylate kinase